MPFPQSLLAEYDHEMKTTRSLLERVPYDNAGWKPHPKSTSLGGLATHLANLAGYGVMVAETDGVNFANRKPSPEPASQGEMLARFDENVAKTRAAIEKMDPSTLSNMWTLQAGDHVIFSVPKSAAFRTFLMNHMIHHRGQLSVYLRQNEVPLPSIYGPSADS